MFTFARNFRKEQMNKINQYTFLIIYFNCSLQVLYLKQYLAVNDEDNY